MDNTDLYSSKLRRLNILAEMLGGAPVVARLPGTRNLWDTWRGSG